MQRLFTRFVVGCDSATAKNLWQPFANAIEHQPEEVAGFWRDIIIAQDVAPSGEAFWVLWQMTADRLVQIPNLAQLASPDRRGYSKLLAGLFLDGVHWKESAREWQPLAGHAESFQKLFKQTGSIPSVFKAMVRTLDSIGNFLLPDALIWLDEHLNAHHDEALLGSRNTLFSLARIMSPLIYGQTSTLRKSTLLRQSALKLLNAMIEQGSSAAFRMREFLITPTSPP